jgi:hypothetical protein
MGLLTVSSRWSVHVGNHDHTGHLDHSQQLAALDRHLRTSVSKLGQMISWRLENMTRHLLRLVYPFARNRDAPLPPFPT